MNCFPCFSSQKRRNSLGKNDTHDNNNNNDEHVSRPPVNNNNNNVVTTKQTEERGETEQSPVKIFNFRELATATKNFRQECLIGEGGSGRVYKGTLKSTGQLVAVKQLDKHGLHGGNKEFQAEVLSLAKLEHTNLVKLIGYCSDGDQRLLVFEYVSGGSLQDHLYEQKASEKPMDWITRMKIAFGAAQGLDYLHDKVNPPVIYRDLKASNILLDEEFYPKLCDFGMHNLKQGTKCDSMFLSSSVMDTYGYSAPEYTRGEELTVKSDVYSFGVVLLELITGRRAVDTTKPNDEQNLVSWAQPIFRDPKRYPDMADPLLSNNFSERGLNQAVAITSMCLQEEPTARPLVSDVMVALSFLSMSTEGIPTAGPMLSFRDKSMSIALSRHGSCSVVPFSLSRREEDGKSSVSSDSEEEDREEKEEEEEEETISKKKQDSNFEKDSKLKKGRDSSSSSDSRRSIDGKNAAAQSLKMKYSYSSEEEEEEEEEEDEERLSNKDSTPLRYNVDEDHDDDDDDDSNTSMRINSLAHDDEEEGEKHEHRLEHIHSSKYEVQSVDSDDDDDGEESGGSSFHRIEQEKEEEEEHSSSDKD